MKDIFQKILEQSIPYYEKGRVGDVDHVRWLLQTVSRFLEDTDLDETIVMPVVLLHDVGYSAVPEGANPYELDIRIMHSEEGAKIAERILLNLDYPLEKIEEVKRLILKHDNWAFGDSFDDEPILQFFGNFDFMWMASAQGFDIVRQFLDQRPGEFYKQIRKFQQKNEEEGRTWFNKDIADHYEKLMQERKAALENPKGENAQ